MDSVTNRLIPKAGVPASEIYVLGELAADCLYYTNSLAMVSRRVEMVADEIAKLAGT
jgi:hypothetical protein